MRCNLMINIFLLGTIQIKGKGVYEGELNSNGEAHGKGTFTNSDGDVYKGTFYWNKFNGYCKKFHNPLTTCAQVIASTPTTSI